MDKTALDDRIRKLDPLNALSNESYKKIFNKIRVEQLPKGRTIFRQGETDKTYVYVMEGEIGLFSEKQLKSSIVGASDLALKPLEHSQPRHFTAITQSDAVMVSIESQTLDMIMAWEASKNYEVREIEESIESNADDWMARLLANPLFHRTPPRSLQSIFNHFEPMPVEKNQLVVDKGEIGDCFFILASGKASVTYFTPQHPNGLRLAILKPGDFFGEDALISAKPRNASIRMLEKGMLLKLSQQHFREQLLATGTHSVTFAKASSMVQSGLARWLDVRLPQEFNSNHLSGASNLPLILMRVKHSSSLDHSQQYITYCDNGKRGAAGAFILRQKGYDVFTLDKGLEGQHPQEATKRQSA